jgi:hypothetical protein
MDPAFDRHSWELRASREVPLASEGLRDASSCEKPTYHLEPGVDAQEGLPYSLIGDMEHPPCSSFTERHCLAIREHEPIPLCLVVKKLASIVPILVLCVAYATDCSRAGGHSSSTLFKSAHSTPSRISQRRVVPSLSGFAERGILSFEA